MPQCLRRIGLSVMTGLALACHVPLVAWGQPTVEKPTRPTAAFLALDRSPVGAILEAELLQQTVATWVERTEIGKVLDEQKLQALFAPEAVGERVKFGKLLKADLLVLVRSGKQDAVPYVDVAVAEVARGLRLAHRRIPASTDPATDAALLFKVVTAGFARQRKPIEFLFAVPPFVSNDLIHEHDDLRGAYSRLVESQLLEQPNTLVVELAEGEAITRELALAAPGDPAAANMVARSLPHYLTGRYRNEGRGKSRRVEIELALKHGPHELAQAKGVAKPEDVPQFLHREVAAFLKQITGRVPTSVEPKVEAGQLLRSANEQLKLGGFEEAVSLAEASLLLEPNQVEPHVVALRALTPVLRKHWQHQVYSMGEVQLAMSFYLRGVHHVSLYFRNGGKGDQYTGLGEGTFLGEFFAAAMMGVHPYSSPEVKRYMAEVQAQNREALLEVIDLVIGKSSLAASFFLNCGVAGLTDEETCDLQRELILQYQHLPNARAITRSFCCRGHTLDVLNRPGEQALLDALEKQGNEDVRAEVVSLRKAVEVHLANLERQRKLRESYTVPLEPVPSGAERLVIQPVKLESVDSRGNSREVKSLDGVLATSAGFDVAWAGNSLYLMHRKGTLEEVFSSNTLNGRFWRSNEFNGHSGVCFDGTYVWAACYDHTRDTRLIVIDPATKQVSEITAEQGLPNPNVADAGPNRVVNLLSLAPISPGRILVAGGFGRAWLAEVEFKPGTGGKVRVFHEAKETQDGGNREQWRSATVSFKPGDIFPVAGSKEGDSKRFLIGRVAANPDLLEHPLVVDPKTQAVEVCAGSFWSESPRLHLSPMNDSVYFVRSVPPAHTTLSLMRVGSPDFKRETVVALPREGDVLAEPGRVHVVGKQWWIVDLATNKVTPAGPVPWTYSNRWAASGPGYLSREEPDRPRLQLLARSNHYGIIAYHTGGKDPRNASLVQVSFSK